MDQLKKNNGGFWLALFQSMAFVAPAASVASFFTTGVAAIGGSLPLTYIIATFGVLSAMYMDYSFAKRISHAGGYYAFVRSGLGNKLGTLSAWFYLYDMIAAIAGFSTLYFGAIVAPYIPFLNTSPYGWLPLSLIPFAIVFFFLWNGLRPSLWYTLISSVAEISFLVIGAIIIIILLGSKNTLAPFTLTGHPISALGLATVYSVLSFVGAGSVIALSEEIKNPRKNIPKALVIVALLAAAVYILASYAVVVGWGLSNISSFATSTNPGITVYARYLGPVGLVIFVVLVANSFISNGIAQGNAGSRTAYSMARDNILFSSRWAKVNERTGAPRMVIGIMIIVTFILMIVFGLIFGPFEGGTILITAEAALLYIIHILGDISLPIYAKRKLKYRLKAYLPLLLGPMPATIVYAVAEYGVFIPIPAYPNSIYVYGTLALIGVGIVLAITIRHKPVHVDQSVFEQEAETK
ncbi:APC family permease [Ferroplasma acidiphilum]|uniref:APC family permease n=1 Tax=Ferroplasma acidiphilum TaxID=74969 RepID=A0A7K4FLP5_9ARCH|nr:APC family permease [Ferroplasma acidiphilum]NOL59711.1 APC family permease [Ferroplasma acidiphilum]